MEPRFLTEPIPHTTVGVAGVRLAGLRMRPSHETGEVFSLIARNLNMGPDRDMPAKNGNADAMNARRLILIMFRNGKD